MKGKLQMLQTQSCATHLLSVKLDGTLAVLESKQHKSSNRASQPIALPGPGGSRDQRLLDGRSYGPLLDESSQFSDAASLLAENFLGVCSTDLRGTSAQRKLPIAKFVATHNDLGAGVGHTDLTARETWKKKTSI